MRERARKIGMATRVPAVPGAMGMYPAPKPAAKKRIKEFVFPSPLPSPPRGEGGVRGLSSDNDSSFFEVGFDL
jgi:hypothetical protein